MPFDHRNRPRASDPALAAHDRRALLAGLGGLAAAAAIAHRARAGPLDPPAGPIAGTGKTLAQVEPRIPINAENTPGTATALFRITQPGSYYLTGNVTGVTGRRGIEVAANDVTIDLNGFSLIGVPGSSTGVFSVGDSRRLALRNGVVRNWGSGGVNISAATAPAEHLIEGIMAVSNLDAGIVAGRGSVVRACIARANSQFGIYVRSGSVVCRCATAANGAAGIAAESNCTISECVSTSDLIGIECTDGCSVTACAVRRATGNGVRARDSCAVVDCVAYDGQLSGIVTGARARVATCIAANNTYDGIECANRSFVSECVCVLNGAGNTRSGLVLTERNSRAEGNLCTRNGYGVRAYLDNNFIIRNTCSGNTFNFGLASGNRILAVNSTAAGVVSGNLGGASLGSTDPWANFSF